MASGVMPPAQVVQHQGCNQQWAPIPRGGWVGRAGGCLSLVLGAEAVSPRRVALAHPALALGSELVE